MLVGACEGRVGGVECCIGGCGNATGGARGGYGLGVRVERRGGGVRVRGVIVALGVVVEVAACGECECVGCGCCCVGDSSGCTSSSSASLSSVFRNRDDIAASQSVSQSGCSGPGPIGVEVWNECNAVSECWLPSIDDGQAAAWEVEWRRDTALQRCCVIGSTYVSSLGHAILLG